MGNRFNAKFAVSEKHLDEIEATESQKLEIRRLGYSDQGVIDTLGADQASDLIERLEAHPSTRMWQRTFKSLLAMGVVSAGVGVWLLGIGHFARFSNLTDSVGFVISVAGAGTILLGTILLHR